ncbi:MAG: N-formylglutamate amidohydrolase [Armatimonadota bacterium]|jgi:N-formylglutamate deformylase|nr:hypothetical protein CCB81_02445 [Armatimonadetes bacterium Uphvl-Ar2]MCZ8139528.1 N-formylglutamate amidohydrolase [Fimbriimonadaceae bacterium]
MKPILLHIPHASLFIPENVRPTFLVDQTELERELLVMTDRHTDELFQLESAERLVFGVSRLVVDPERFEDDADEPMAKRGMGAVYTRTSSGSPLKSEAGREHLISEYYRPHHEELNDWARNALSEHGRCLLIDCHSYPSQPLPCDQDQTPERPMFCVGTDSFHTPPTLAASVVTELEKLAETFTPSPLSTFSGGVLVDRPYSGTMVPSQFYGLDPRVQSIMIEFNRSLYMDEETGEKLLSFHSMRGSLAEVLWVVAETWARG